MIIVTTPDRVIIHNILLGMKDILNKQLPKTIQNIKSEVQAEVISAFRSSRIYQELVIGDLRKHFGLPKGQEFNLVDTIIQKIASSVIVDYVPIALFGTNFQGGIVIHIQKEGFADLLTLPEAVVDNNPWLDWLIMQGDRIIVSDFSVAFGNFPFSRSGDAIMIKNIGGFWKVPSFASGTPNNNWITRTLELMQNNISDIVEKQVKKVLQ